MYILLKLLLILVIGGLDFLRGNTWPVGWGGAKKLLLGFVLSYASGLTDWWLLVGSVLWALSYANGWGSMLGVSLDNARGGKRVMYSPHERWQELLGNVLPRVLHDARFALAMRGVLAFLYVSPLIYINPGYILMLPILAFAYLAPVNWTANIELFGRSHWKRYEIVRGLVTGLGAAAISFCTL